MPEHSCDLIPVPSSNNQAQQMDSTMPNPSFPKAKALSVETTITHQILEAGLSAYKNSNTYHNSFMDMIESRYENKKFCLKDKSLVSAKCDFLLDISENKSMEDGSLVTLASSRTFIKQKTHVP